MHLAYITEIGNLNEDLTKSLEFIKWRRFVKSDSTVFIKPNFTFHCHERGVTTTPALLRSLLGIVRNRAGRVILGESDGGYHSFKAEEAFEGHGVYEMCKENGVEVVSLSKLPSRFVEGNVQSKKVRVQLPRMLLEEVDCFISVPVLKVHAMTKVTLSIKNLWGCWPDSMRLLHHQNLDHKLALMTKVLGPRIAVIDGTYGLDRHGPMFGEPVRMNLLMVADNPVVADALGASIMGFSPKKIKHIRLAEKEGLGTTDLKEVKLNRDWKLHRRRFHIERTLLDMISVFPFRSAFLAKTIFDSPLTRHIYRVADVVRVPGDKQNWDKL